MHRIIVIVIAACSLFYDTLAPYGLVFIYRHEIGSLRLNEVMELHELQCYTVTS